jgi:SAM-dependent methyltransferase
MLGRVAPSDNYREWLRSRHRPAHGRRSAERNAGFFLPFLRPGMRLLDAGCGPGAIAVGFAKRVPPGDVVGVDSDAQGIEAARRLASSLELTNAQFAVASLYALPFDDQVFDGAFVHAVVQHLHDPVAALREVHRVLRPGAVIGVADADLSMDLLHPATPCMVRSMQLLADLRRADGGTPDAGRRLRELLSLAGFSRCTASATPVADGTAEGIARAGERWSAYFSAAPLIERMEEAGLATRDQLLEIANDWRAWATDSAAFCAAFWCEAIGWK